MLAATHLFTLIDFCYRFVLPSVTFNISHLVILNLIQDLGWWRRLNPYVDPTSRVNEVLNQVQDDGVEGQRADTYASGAAMVIRIDGSSPTVLIE